MSNVGIPQEEKEKELIDLDIQRKQERYMLSYTFLQELINELINDPEDTNLIQNTVEYMNATLYLCKRLKAQIRLMEKEKKK